MDVERRTVLQVAGLAAVGGLAAACSSGSTTGGQQTGTDSSALAAPSGSAASGAAGTTMVALADVPVGGGLISPDPPVVITQPTAGEARAFSAICTHEGCLVGSVENNEIICPCHGARFSATDGSVLQGPAQEALAPAVVVVDANGNVVLSG
jgi:nitrite reductase/ring-hydroxylating ferredoxin subunit